MKEKMHMRQEGDIPMHIFISHSSKDSEEALKICELLENNGEKCFIAPRDIRLGKTYAEELVRGIDESKAVVLLMSGEANESPHVLREVERAVSKSIPILIYKLEEIVLSKSMEYFLMTHQWINAKPDEGYQSILDFVKTLREQQEPDKVQAGQKKSASANLQETSNVMSESKQAQNKSVFTVGVLLLAGIIAFGGYCLATGNHEKNTTKLATQIKVGDTITFGSYNGEPIGWRVLKIDDTNGKAVLVSKDILTMKAFDAAESGKYNQDDTTDYWSQENAADTDMELQAYVRGNSDWSTSNIRTWLNSGKEIVLYEDQPPVATAMAEMKNGYNNEPGFLYGFTEDEIAAICETEIVTNGNALSETETITTMDRVYLLSLDELKWFEDAGISQLAIPTIAAMEQDKTEWYDVDLDVYGVKEYCWWLREPVENMSGKCYLVGNGYTEDNIRKENAGLEGFGVRPATTVDIESLSLLLKDNTEE